MPTTFKLYKPAAINEQGGRGNNEDSVYPPMGEASEETRLFLVCDGVGGEQKGEVASQILSSSVANYFAQHADNHIDSQYVAQAIQFAEQEMTDYQLAFPESLGMASTLTLLAFHDQMCIMSWVGDSRIYHVRKGEIFFKSKDHSLVNLLVDRGEILESEAAKHPQRNVILRAIQGKEVAAEAEVVQITDIQPKDYFLLCTDGVLENVTDDYLRYVFDGKKSPQAIADEIKDFCLGRTKDNFSLYVVQVKSANTPKNANSSAQKSSKSIWWILFSVLLISVSGFVFWKYWMNTSKTDIDQQPKQTPRESVVNDNALDSLLKWDTSKLLLDSVEKPHQSQDTLK